MQTAETEDKVLNEARGKTPYQWESKGKNYSGLLLRNHVSKQTKSAVTYLC